DTAHGAPRRGDAASPRILTGGSSGTRLSAFAPLRTGRTAHDRAVAVAARPLGPHGHLHLLGPRHPAAPGEPHRGAPQPPTRLGDRLAAGDHGAPAGGLPAVPDARSEERRGG